MSGIWLWILLVLYSCELRRAQQQPYCSKIDFNRPVVNGFRECAGKFLPEFFVKRYVDSPWLQPYRPTSQYYLSNKVEGYSCAESVTKFHLNANSEIDSAIYLDFEFAGAFIEVLVIDADTKKTINQWKNETAGGWFMLRKKIGVTVRNAQIEFRANANKNSRLAVEYIHILNSAVQLADCKRDPDDPTSSSTNAPDSTTQSSTSTTVETTTASPSAEPMDGSEMWTIIGIVIGVILLIILLLLVIFFIIRYRKRKLLVVAPQRQARTINSNNQATLPRLRVVNDKVNGVSIVGGDVYNNN